ncbi:1-deoxy-D-xylulose-5-phosphate reductoisomerase [Longimicrobium sp.]|uniref:1-deoxy-D-xylulose-5-phosphate reductoisomerase n=1 Tax=Longimicrobium sp. TaxID=2029185 RepID=UPI002E34198B|nr:1-deoxy-D-xylulose-5-phosphate reductoisomerase [Longimicrobium sp.]HEX6040375.1 1-deoxy-D-xylulose-5-phosphate reductoisomerase [Longimicrobium sp.]
MKGVAILGATGSIGASALAVLAQHPDRFRAVALTAHRSADALRGLVARHRPSLAVLSDAEVPADAGGPTRWASGREALLEAATHPDADIVVNALVGAAGLEPTLAALEAGKRVALANKESLVCGGPLVLQAAERGGGELIPVDSEHSAIFQCLAGSRPGEVRRLILTASGGPFRCWAPELISSATAADALRHPTWDMGSKITIDSATLANKALEVIEAHFLFGVPYARIEAVVHPQSIIHSMVETVDGSVLAQMGFPTMELPVLYALAYPERLPYDSRRFDPVAAGTLTFEPVRDDCFPAFALGVRAGLHGGTTPAVFNAANEVAVAEFLAGRIPFGGIADSIADALERWPGGPVRTLDDVREADAWARRAAHTYLTRLAPC